MHDILEKQRRGTKLKRTDDVCPQLGRILCSVLGGAKLLERKKADEIRDKLIGNATVLPTPNATMAPRSRS